METIKIEIPGEKIQEAFIAAANDIFKSTYSNPVKDLLEKAIKGQEGKIKDIVDEMVVQAIGTVEFKTKIADAVVKNMVEAAMRR